MNESPDMPDYGRFDQALESIGLDIGGSEAHGLVCGLICAGASEAHVEWIESLFADRPSNDLLVREARRMFGQLYLATRHQVADENLEFAPLLPEENNALQVRAQALVNWCEGYLYGMGLAGISEQQLVGDAKEALNDISEFTRLDLDSLVDDESSENAYMELLEFLRVATLLIWEELAESRAGQNNDIG
ncbi:MAG: UPF0149 family protein [Candidatus Thiodiazotropha sp. (ex Monitilora ramsayi)]|nr:UPF0149 family protein [Candidatus Thiodiazotropha sp. (ex Monitilora ramsayi)]